MNGPMNGSGFVKMLAQAGLLCLAAGMPAVARGQVAEAAVRPINIGFQLPSIGGNLNYAVRGSESFSTGYYRPGQTSIATNISGDLAYLSQSATHPISVIYSGGVIAANQNQPTYTFQNLAISQVLLTRLWSFTATDSVNYLPSSQTTGLSGVAGQGDLGVDPVQTGPVTGQGALTGYAPQVDNVIVGNASRRLTGKTSMQGTFSYLMQRFTSDSPGLFESNQALGSFGVSHMLNARSSVSGDYTFSKVTYSSAAPSSGFNIESVSGTYSRRFNQNFSLDASLGPQWVTVQEDGGHTSLNLSIDLAAIYKTRKAVASVSYVRGTNSGFGVTRGGFSDSINSSANRTFLRIYNAAVSLNYTSTANLEGVGAAASLHEFRINTLVAGVQASRAITRTVSSYASYTAQHQSASGLANSSGAFQGLFQVFAFGLTYSPRGVSFGAR